MEEVRTHVGGRIRLYRKAKHFTLTDLAARIHKSKATLSKYETGEITVDIETLFDIAEALGISVFQLIDYAPGTKEEPLPVKDSFFPQDRIYLYFYDGRVKKVVRNLLEIRRSGAAPSATLYYDLASFDRPESCRNLYYGKVEFFDTVSNFLFESQSNHSERVTLTALNPFDRGKEVLGMLSGMSRYPLLPISIKCILSAEPLTEDDAMREELILSQKDLKLIRRLNMFAVEQF